MSSKLRAQTITTPIEEFERLPERSGIYILKNSTGSPVYVGKASSIRARVLAHLRPRTDDPVGNSLKDQISSVDYIFTQTPIEALILENVLIKRYKPKYNIRLKDDKSYPYIKVTLNEPAPRVFVTRQVLEDGARYFGPYGNVRAARRTLKYLRRIFPIRGCTLPLDWKKSFRSCIDYNMGLCSAPCIFAVSRERYNEEVRKFNMFLEGKLVQLSKLMYDDMWQASESEEFELASKIRDDIRSLETTALKQRIAFPNQTVRDKDVVTIAKRNDLAAAVVFQVRDGNVIGREKFILDGVSRTSSDGEILSAFIKQHYGAQEAKVGELPQEIVVSEPLPDTDEIKSLISAVAPSNKAVILSSTGSLENKQLTKLANENAILVLKEEESKDEVKRREKLRALKDLKEVLNLGKIPKRIECFDISNLRGEDAVGAMTVFVDGFPEKSEYRKFKIRTVKGIDDYSMMAEMVERRLRRLMEERNKAPSQPDLVIIDGGKGHLSAVLAVMRKQGVFGIPTVSIAKEEELIFVPNRVAPIRLGKDSEALHVVQHIRDEAHRFGITYHRRLRSKGVRRSVLDEVPRIGEKRKRNLLAHFGSVDAIRRASEEEIAQVAKISRKLALVIIANLSKNHDANI